MVTTNQEPKIATQKITRKDHKDTTKENIKLQGKKQKEEMNTEEL